MITHYTRRTPRPFWRTPPTPKPAAPAPTSEMSVDDFAKILPKPKVIHMSAHHLSGLYAYPNGEEMACDGIGLEGDGLDDESMQTLMQVLLTEESIQSNCVEGLVHRLASGLGDDKLGVSHTPSEKSVLAVGRKVLQNHPDEVSKVLRETYYLGGKEPQLEVEEILSNLKVRTSCGDIKKSLDLMEKSTAFWANRYRKLYRQVCLNGKPAPVSH